MMGNKSWNDNYTVIIIKKRYYLRSHKEEKYQKKLHHAYYLTSIGYTHHVKEVIIGKNVKAKEAILVSDSSVLKGKATWVDVAMFNRNRRKIKQSGTIHKKDISRYRTELMERFRQRDSQINSKPTHQCSMIVIN